MLYHLDASMRLALRYFMIIFVSINDSY